MTMLPNQSPAMPAQQPMQQPVNGMSMLSRPKIGEKDLVEANRLLSKYKAGKQSLERRVISAEQWWKMRHFDEIIAAGITNPDDIDAKSAWLFNSVKNAYADHMVSYPSPNILPREADDKAEAQKLTSIVPVALQQNDFEEVYSDCGWQKIKAGTAIYGVFWDSSKLGGLGDITIKCVDLLNIFWEPGITDIQKSRNVFCVELVDNDLLESQYPQLEGKLKGKSLTLNKYVYDDNVDTTAKSLVVDWYYHSRGDILQYCKYVNNTVLYSSEDDPAVAETGWYAHGKYPFIFDKLYPVAGSPCGFGLIDVCKSPQMVIDMIGQAIAKNSVMASTPRYFMREDGSVNESEFTDWKNPVVHCTGNLGEESLREIRVTPLSDVYLSAMNNKIDELKQTSGNQDVANGMTSGGATAYSAIAALQEVAGKGARASNGGSYRAYNRLITMVIELIRQFYDMPRQFRIIGEMGREEFIAYDNTGLKPVSQGNDFGGDMGYRLPVFDIEVSAEKDTPYNKLSQNELAMQLFNLGVFNPQMSDQALMLLDMMDFPRKQTLMQKIARNGTIYEQLIMYQQLALQLAAKYEPEMAEGLSQQIMQQGGIAPVQQQGGALTQGAEKKEHPFGEKARQRADSTTRPQ